MASKTITNGATRAVFDSIDGLLVTRQDLVRLDGFPGIKVVRRRELEAGKVGLVSGGGSGHEPSHAGLVGPGLLTSAVCGEVFASPQVNAVLAGILSADTGAGVLVIVKNYTGDRLAFSLAAEQAKALGKKVEVVFVADDIALGEGHSSVIGKRGVAGTVLVHKVAGAFAESGASLEVVAAAARAVAESVVSIGYSLTTCRVPGVPQSDRLDAAGASELGLGIHGEPGAQRLETIPKADELVATMLEKALAAIAINSKSKGNGAEIMDVAVLVNNLGGLSNLEMGIVVKSTLAKLSQDSVNVRVVRLIAGPLMTALDMKGFSLSLLPVAAATVTGEKDMIWALDFPVGAHAAWPVVVKPLPGQTSVTLPCAETGRIVALPAGVASAAASSSSAAGGGSDGSVLSFEAVLARIDSNIEKSPNHFSGSTVTRIVIYRAALSACRKVADPGATELLNKLDAITGDADCGATFKVMADAALKAINAEALSASSSSSSSMSSPPVDAIASLADNIGREISLVAGGSSGVIYALGLQAFANHLRSFSSSSSSSSSPTHACCLAFKAALETLIHATDAKPGDRTMLDALAPAADKALSTLSAPSSGGQIARAAAEAAAHGAEATAEMQPRAGRASYVSFDVARGHRDPGAVAASLWLAGLAEGLIDTY